MLKRRVATRLLNALYAHVKYKVGGCENNTMLEGIRITKLYNSFQGGGGRQLQSRPLNVFSHRTHRRRRSKIHSFISNHSDHSTFIYLRKDKDNY